MKSNRSLLLTLVALIVIAAFYRLIPGRPLGFAPQLAMAIFGGAVIKDKKWAFALPIFSMFLSDCLFQALHTAGLTDIYGFYDGQLLNYGLFALMVFIGFAIRGRLNVWSIGIASLAAPTVFFLLSNFATWSGMAGGLRGWDRPLTFGGFMMALNDGLPFYQGSLAATVIFSVLLFGTYFLLNRKPAGIAMTA